MSHRLPLVGLAFLIGLAGATKPAPTGRAENGSFQLTATLYADRDAVKQLLGNDLAGYYVLVEVRLVPKAKLPVYRDDFTLRTDRDGERSKPYAPSQIAGRGVLIVSQTGGGGAIMGDQRGPVWGGAPGTGDRPRRVGGDGGGIGNASAVTTPQATVDTGAKQKEDPMMTQLNEKVLPEKETDQPVAGLLFFPMEPKQKPRDLELIYTTPTGKLSTRFK